jgi:hypothetical protein
MVAETGNPKLGSQCLFSFSRYDYYQGDPTPVLSSSSSHHLPVSFHRQEDWGLLSFVE